jgi:hypothetical protein
MRQQRVQEAIDAAIARFEEADADDIPIPPDLEGRIREKLRGTAKAWDQVLWDLMTDGALEAEEDEDEEEIDG